VSENDQPPPHPWFKRRRGDPGHVPEDPADVGTAFGLDLSMDPEQPAPRQAAGDGTARPGWARRVLGRGKTSR
jgi:hypothetical protein